MTNVTSGIERKVDGLGRIVIPAEMRERFGLREGDHVDIAVRDGAIVLTPMRSAGRAVDRAGSAFGRTGDEQERTN